MSRHTAPVHVGAEAIADAERPIRVWARDGDGELVDVALSVVLAWELMIALGEQVATHPAPALPAHPYRLRALAAAERPPLGSYWSGSTSTHPSPVSTHPSPVRPPQHPGR